jgi:hypothetical protein
VSYKIFGLFLVHKISTYIHIYVRKREKRKKKKVSRFKRTGGGILTQPKARTRARAVVGPARPATGHGARG